MSAPLLIVLAVAFLAIVAGALFAVRAVLKRRGEKGNVDPYDDGVRTR